MGWRCHTDLLIKMEIGSPIEKIYSTPIILTIIKTTMLLARNLNRFIDTNLLEDEFTTISLDALLKIQLKSAL